MPNKIIDYAPHRNPKQRSFAELIPGAFLFGLLLVAPADLPIGPDTAAAPIPTPLISPVPTIKQSLFPTIPLSEKQAGSSAAERSDPVGIVPGPSVELSDSITIIREVFGPDGDMAIAIATAESHLNCNAYSTTNDGGLFQVNLTWHMAKFAGQSPYDCLANTKVAKQIFDAQGWSPWTTYRTGAFRRYL